MHTDASDVDVKGVALRRCIDAVRSEIGESLADYDAAGYDAHAVTLNVLRAQTIRA